MNNNIIEDINEAIMKSFETDIRFINANQLLQYISTLEPQSKDKTYQKAMGDMLEYYFPKIVANVPSLDARLNIRAKWIDKTAWIGSFGACKYECSNCGYQISHKPQSRGDGRGGKFCDNCGAMMEDLK